MAQSTPASNQEDAVTHTAPTLSASQSILQILTPHTNTQAPQQQQQQQEQQTEQPELQQQHTRSEESSHYGGSSCADSHWGLQRQVCKALAEGVGRTDTHGSSDRNSKSLGLPPTVFQQHDLRRQGSTFAGSSADSHCELQRQHCKALASGEIEVGRGIEKARSAH